MKSFFLSLFLFLLQVSCSFGQDVITTIRGIAFHAKIESETEQTIRYKKTDNTTAVYSMAKTDIHLIKYENGSQLFLNPVLPEPSPEPKANFPLTASGKPATNAFNRADTLTLKELYTLGKADASIYYKGYKEAGTYTFISSFLFWPAGMVTAISTASTPPKARNFTYPDASLGKNPEYVRGYHGNARKIKSKKVWSNFGAGFGTALGLAILYVSRQ
ncbi:hypothetical protein I5M27_05190 [Adhaeribacter sp. BT258]|uniref:Uncharacterized protein n=1 Tax=Adhaeribacter terrigena TaxID=2793070 RepID=A0ABS1BZ91_9BACT|nr:hypothetical protein [Adhaeribacter terrigena]MBK0402368.1 hypothetical protein [Adhaeribacter terrigena]